MNSGRLQDNRIRLVVKSLSAFLGAILLVAGLVNLFGYVVTGLIAIVGFLVLWIATGQVVSRAIQQPNSRTAVPQSKPERPTVERDSKIVCPRGTYSVKAGGDHKIRLNVGKSDPVGGLLEEISEQPFDYYIADDPNLVYFKQRNFRKFKPIAEDHNEPAYHVNVRIPSDGRWWLILDMYNLKFSRSVRVDFEEIRPTDISPMTEQVVKPGGQSAGCDKCNFPQTLYPPDSERIILKSDRCAQGDSARITWRCNKCHNTNVRYWDRRHPLIGFAKIR